ncbi:MAG: site-specific integrase [Gemmatimonadetes bacterium]|nr:site-specific integrase [Gemmatimonadota bacterium]
MPRPRGSLRQRPDGQWSARYSAGLDPITGKRIQTQRTFPDRKAAQKWLTAEQHAQDQGERTRRLSGGPTLAAYLRQFYADDRRGARGRLLSDRVCAVDLDLMERYVIRRAPAVAETPLPKLTTEQLARVFRMLATGDDAHGGLARATVSRVYRVLSARLNHAVDLGLLRQNPLYDARRGKRSKLVAVDGKRARDHRTLSELQAQAFLAVALEPGADRYGVLFALMLWTGLRPGEATGLTWADVDLEGRVLTVRRALVRTRGAWELRDTKTETARRVPFPEPLALALRAHRARQAEERLRAGSEYRDHGLLFCAVEKPGHPVCLPAIARRHFKPLLIRAAYYLLGRARPALPPQSRSEKYRDALKAQGVADAAAMRDAEFPSVSLYELRHTQATMLLRRGVHPKIVADRLGHARTATTLDVYSHVTPDMQQQAVAELERALGAEPVAARHQAHVRS